LGEVRGGGPPPPGRLCPRHNHLFSEPRTNYSLSGKGAHSDSGWRGWGEGGRTGSRGDCRHCCRRGLSEPSEVRATIICPQNTEQNILSLVK